MVNTIAVQGSERKPWAYRVQFNIVVGEGIKQVYSLQDLYELRHEKTGLLGFRPDPIQSRLYDHTRRLEA